MTQDPMKNTVICTGIFTFVLSMVILGVVDLCWELFEIYVSLPVCVLISLLVTAAAVSSTWLWLRVRQLEGQNSFLRDRLFALEKKLKTV